LFETLRSNRSGAYENPGSLLTALETNPHRDNDEMRELRREVAEYVDENYARCDWPYMNDDVLWRGVTPHEKFIGGLTCMEDGYAASSSEDGNISILNYTGDEPIAQFAGHGGEPVNHIIYDRERRLLISSGDDFRIRIWNPDTQEEIAVLEGHDNYVSRLALCGNRLLSASKDQTVGVWDLENRQLLRKFTGHKDWVYNLAISPDGSEAVSCSLDNNILHWDVETGTILHELNEGARRASFLVNGEELYIRLKGTAKTPYRPIGHTVIWPRKDLLITAGYQIAFWNTDTWEIDRLSRVVTREIGQLRVAGDVLIAVSNSIAGFDIDTGSELFNIIAHEKKEIKSV
ncbi:MAG TPA: hypothetical protein PKK43_17700, partial [Spirochaetota bacterium]|nr:hypothetical protein [Spirochaetota bacterium]